MNFLKNIFQKDDYPSVVIIGNAGLGKTTLLNKICHSEEKVKSGGKSVTNNLILQGSAYGKGFYVIDTPGFGSLENQYKDLVSVYYALIQNPLNLILVTIRFERIDIMLQQIKQKLFMLHRFRDQVCIAITHWDQSENKLQDEEEIKKTILQKYKINHYILSGKEVTGEKICQDIDKILQNTKQKSIQLSETEFLTQFNLEIIDEYTLQMQQEVNQLINQFKQIYKKCIEFIKEQDGAQDETSELMYALITAIKIKGHEIVNNFQISRGYTFDQILEKYNSLEFAYIFPMHLKKQILELIQEVITLAQSKIKLNQNHIYNNLKACPRCNLVWLKVCGCDSVSCGSFPLEDRQDVQPFMPKYQIVFKDDNIQINQNEVAIQQKRYSFFNKWNWNLKGCGYDGKWSTWKVLTDKQINELQDIGFQDILNNIKQEDIQQQQNKFKSYTEKLMNSVKENMKIDLKNLQNGKNKWNVN